MKVRYSFRFISDSSTNYATWKIVNEDMLKKLQKLVYFAWMEAALFNWAKNGQFALSKQIGR